MNKLLIILSVIFINTSIYGQFIVEDYKWADKPNYQINKELAEDYSAIVLIDYRIKEFYGGKYQKPLEMSHSDHFAVKILDKTAVEAYNRVYVPSYGNLIEVKARTIKADGSIIELSQDKMKTIEDERYGGYTIFAVEGVEKGDIVEYIYKRTLTGDYCGIEIFQKDIPVQKAVFEIKSTSSYNIDTKTYNGLSRFKTQKKDNHIISASMNLPAIADESSTSLNDYKMRAAYRIENLISPYGDKFEVITWEQISKNIHSFGEVDRMKGISKLFKELGLNASMATDDKIIILEKYFKENFTYKQDRSASADKFKNILKNKYGNEVDLTRAMKYLLRILKVPSVWMISTNKSYIKVDPNFPNTQGLREHILYFPTTKKYVAMGYQAMRYGPPPISVIENYGLIIDKNGGIEKIEYDLSKHTMQNIVAKVNFNDDFSKAVIDKTLSTSGFKSTGIRGALNSGREDIIKNITHDYMTNYMGDAKVLDTKVENESFDLIYKNTPLVINANIEANELIEDAEDFYIFSFGKIIGQQSELYQERERITPVELDYPLEYFTTIEITVPKGYTVSGLEDCAIKNECKDGSEMMAGFESSATQDGDIVTIKLYEFYNATEFSTDKYEDYRKVINSAADFNKLVLIFEKE